MDTPWAVLLCKFNDDASDPHDRAFYERLFTASGVGSNNMVDFFRDMSHGNIDCSGSVVFGPYTVPHARHEYDDLFLTTSFAVRRTSMGWARQAAMDAGVDLTPFPYTIVVWNVFTDLWGGGGPYAAADASRCLPALLGEEMGHGYGLAHSRFFMSSIDYTDPWDGMSAWTTFSADDPTWGTRSIGPGFNAWNMRSRGWLDESRVFKGRSGRIQLRPLHRRDLPGYLAMELGPNYLAELRVPHGWDAAVPESAVLIHYFRDNQSYLMPGAPPNSSSGEFRGGDPLAGLTWSTATIDPPMLWESSATVVDIDDTTLTATIEVTADVSPIVVDNVWTQERLVNHLRGEVAVVVDGQLISVPESDPMRTAVRQIALLRSIDNMLDPDLRQSVRRAAYRSIADAARSQVDGLTETKQPGPAIEVKSPDKKAPAGKRKKSAIEEQEEASAH